MVAEGLGGPGTGAYRKARRRLPEALVARLAREVGADPHRPYRAGQAGRLLGGRPVKIVDDTTLSMPDPTRCRRRPSPATAGADAPTVASPTR